jgi:uncharacterized protein (DUF3820 family)
MHGSLPAVSSAIVIPFGKFKGRALGAAPAWYVKWGAENLQGKWKLTMQAEMQRRRSLG